MDVKFIRLNIKIFITSVIKKVVILLEFLKRLKNKALDKRAYTFMIVPHRGDKTYSLSLKMLTIKKCIIGGLCCLVVFGGFHARNMYIVAKAQNDKAELVELRENKDAQEEKLRVLAKATEELQTEMTKVTQLENEVKRSLSTDDKGVSRSGVNRAMAQAAIEAQNYNELKNSDIDSVIAKTIALKENAVKKQAILTVLNSNLVERNKIKAATPSIWPASGDVTSRFGSRTSPGGIGSSSHKGIDIAGAYGSPIYATADGVVEVASWYYGYGLYVKLDHGYGFATAYGHNSSLAVQSGQYVRKGEVIAYMGNSGVSTGTHCHYEVIKNGTPVDPADFL